MNTPGNILHTSIDYAKGIGPAKADLLRSELNIHTFYDLLCHFPLRYVDRSRFYKINELKSNLLHAQVKGIITGVKEEGVGRKKRLKAIFKDETGRVELVWFAGINWVKKSLKIGAKLILFGKPTIFNGKVSFSHPELVSEIEFVNKKLQGFFPVYPSTEKLKKRGMDSKVFQRTILSIISECKQALHENLPREILAKHKFIGRSLAFELIHLPKNANQIKQAQDRLKFEELFFLQLKLLKNKQDQYQTVRGYKFDKVGEHFNNFYSKHLPFELTGAQKRVLRDIRRNTADGFHMNRLIQGDVGSGKTLVALMSMLLAKDNGFQSVLMAPTEILATQHFEGISELLKDMNVSVKLLTGSSKTNHRKAIDDELQSGELDILIGTHAVIQDKIQFKNLGLAIVDEQHRFGVAQRYRLWKKSKLPPHVLVMTATPIPRTLAMTLYGDLENSVIDELPPGRKPITTKHFFDNQRLYVLGFIKEQIKLGRQVYIVYPLIEESQSMDYKDLMDGYESISRYFPIPEYQISIVHGRMKAADKQYEMKRFEEGKTQILVATTVIEVGVNVPNASVMVIESAERFGLSQLHQLRGRVGRGSEQSYCILMTGNKLGSEAKTRMKTMVDTNDGFKISEVDMKLRGPGDISGTRQSGLLDLKLASLVNDGPMMFQSRLSAQKLMDEDPDLEKAENQTTKVYLANLQDNSVNWGEIS